MSYKKKELTGNILVRIVLVFCAAVSIFPTIFAFFTSFKTNEEFYADIWALPKTLRIQNYTDALFEGKIAEYLGNSIFIAVVTLGLVLVLSVFAAYALARLRIPGAEWVLAFMLILQVLPTESMIIPEFMIISKLGLLNIPYASIIFPYVGWLLPGSIVILTNFFKTLPVELLEAARIDGCGEMTTMLRIVLPLMKTSISTCLVFNFCFVWGELMWAQIVTSFSDKGIPLTIGLLNFQGQYTKDWGTLTAAMCLVMIPMYLLFLFTQKYFVQGLTSGSVKG